MSRNNRSWNRNKRGWDDGGSSTSGPKRPPGLKGREIGLFYRSLQILKSKDQAHTMTLKVPPSVVNRVRTLLRSISSLQKDRSEIHTNDVRSEIVKVKKETNQSSSLGTFKSNSTSNLDNLKANDSSNFVSFSPICCKAVDTSIVKNESASLESHNSSSLDFIPLQVDYEFTKPESTKQPDFLPFSKKSSITLPDFIPLDTESCPEYGSDTRNLSLRGGGDHYKYGYYDIVTGTFLQKLEECLSKGISVKLRNNDIEEINVELYNQYKVMLAKEKYKKMYAFRESLPTYKDKEEILKIIDNNQVIVVSGETGCGKSTQVPQIILDDAICKKKGANTKILVTQPRRIAASSIAFRVAAERAEKLGNSTGYVVRLEKVEPRKRGSIIFCTTGILLSELETNQGLTEYSHIILDEVHERDTHVDLAMCMLKQVISKRNDLKLILMSATINAEHISEYFNQCPTIHIEGLAYPVQDIYLEEILQLTGYRLPVQNAHDKKFHKFRGKQGSSKETAREEVYKAKVGNWLDSIKFNTHPDIFKTLSDPRIEDLQIELVLQLLSCICRKEPGAILVFLPGIGEISKLMKLMSNSNLFPSSRYEIYPLHSKLSSLEQHRIFERPPMGVRKIIIATNIAETSITIDDIVYVIDCAKLKLTGLNVNDNILTLKTDWISQANLRQRRGRAGRCQPGKCYHLVTSFQAKNLPEQLLPELQRSNLLEAVLNIKKLRLGKAVDALNMVPDPPALVTIEKSLKHLRQCGALDENEMLTPLGWHLARLPVHPSAGKLLLLGALFGCLDRAACVAAVWGFKDPFQIVIGKEAEVDAAKRSLTLGEPSDHVAISEAILTWEKLGRERGSFAYNHFLSSNTLQLLSDMKNQFADNLKQMGFLSSNDIRSGWENRNAKNISLFKAIVAASLYPNTASVKWITPRNVNKPQRIIVRTPEDGKVNLHPSSVMATPNTNQIFNRQKALCNNPGANWLVYWLKQSSTQLYLFEVTLVYTLPLLFFGELGITDVENSPDECYINISTVKVRCVKETANLLIELRTKLDEVLAAKVSNTRNHVVQHDKFEENVLNAVIEIITAEDEQAEYISDDDPNSDTSDCDSRQKHRY